MRVHAECTRTLTPLTPFGGHWLDETVHISVVVMLGIHMLHGHQADPHATNESLLLQAA